MDCFSPTFSKFFCPRIKSKKKKRENSDFLHVGLINIISELMSVFIGY